MRVCTSTGASNPVEVPQGALSASALTDARYAVIITRDESVVRSTRETVLAADLSGFTDCPTTTRRRLCLPSVQARMTKVRITKPISPIEFEPQSKFVIKPPIERRDACTPRISEFNVIGVLEICHIRRSGGGSINHRTTVQPTRHFPGGRPVRQRCDG